MELWSVDDGVVLESNLRGKVEVEEVGVRNATALTLPAAQQQRERAQQRVETMVDGGGLDGVDELMLQHGGS